MKMVIKLYALLLLIILAGCGGSSSPSTPAQIPTLEGYVQKGPFIKGTNLTIQTLDDDLNATGSTYSTQTTDDLGGFSLDSDITTNYVEIIGSGFYFNEVSGAVSDTSITLRTLSAVSENINVNILTTLAKERISYLITTGGKTFSAAVSEAERDVATIFHIDLDRETGISNFDQMDISKTGNSNAILLAVSATLQGDNTEGELSELISGIISDIRTDGTLDNATLISEIDNNGMALNLSQIRTNLETRYTSQGISGAVVPAFEDYVDNDGDGVIDKDDTSAPAIASTVPTNGAGSVAINSPVTITFDESIYSTSYSSSMIKLLAGSTPVTGTISYSYLTKTVTFTPAANLSSFTTYTIWISGDVMDAAGNKIGTDKSYTFTTSDVTAPTVTSVVPSGSEGIDTNFTATFSEAMDSSTITTSSFSISGGVDGTVSYDPATKTATFNPTGLLTRDVSYTATLTTAVKDANGNAMAANYTWSFTYSSPSAVQNTARLGTVASGLFGSSVASADVNGDGLNDAIGGAPATTGYVDVFMSSGGTGTLLYQKLGAGIGASGLGGAVSAGDINGDTLPEVIMGASTTTGSQGAVYVYSGQDGSTTLYQISGVAGGDLFGKAVAYLGDINGDGYGDFIIGASGADPDGKSAAGTAYVYSGIDGSTILYQIDGEAASDQFGTAVALAGDVNNDGTPDFIVGAAGANSNTGSVYVYSGADGSQLYKKNGEASGDIFGYSVASAGNIDGDGYDDFIVGAPLADPSGTTNAGSVYVYSGSDGSLLYQKDGADGDYLGNSVSSAQNVEIVGRSVFIAGAPYADGRSVAGTGVVYVYSSIDGSVLLSIDGTSNGDLFGTAVCSGDTDGDAREDIIIGARGNDEGSSNGGAVYDYQIQ